MKPIIFSGEMVRAILESRKTQTRRVIKGLINTKLGVEYSFHETKDGMWEIGFDYGNGTGDFLRYIKCPYGQLGDQLWVRETWRDTNMLSKPYAYRANENDLNLMGESGQLLTLKYNWRPSIHMPKEAARIILEIISIGVERIRDITEADAILEGVTGLQCDCNGSSYAYACTDCMNTGWIEPPKLNFMNLWDSINAKKGYSWDSNPWVWVVEFERIDK